MTTVRTSLAELVDALKGVVVMGEALEEMAESLVVARVPAMWQKVSCCTGGCVVRVHTVSTATMP